MFFDGQIANILKAPNKGVHKSIIWCKTCTEGPLKRRETKANSLSLFRAQMKFTTDIEKSPIYSLIHLKNILLKELFDCLIHPFRIFKHLPISFLPYDPNKHKGKNLKAFFLFFLTKDPFELKRAPLIEEYITQSIQTKNKWAAIEWLLLRNEGWCNQSSLLL